MDTKKLLIPQNTKFLRILFYFSIFCAVFHHVTSQSIISNDNIPEYINKFEYPKENNDSIIIDPSNTSEGVCFYSFDPQNRYFCYLFHTRIFYSNQVLVITGEHVSGFTDSDVLGVISVTNRITFFNGEILRKFPNLRVINMAQTFIQVIADDAFITNCGQLEELDITFNEIVNLSSGLLRNCANLRIFRAYVARLRELPEDLFGTTRNLEVFDVNRNGLTVIPENILRNMQNLRIFNIRSNQVAQISSNLLSSAQNLEVIDISANRFLNAEPVMDMLNGHFNLRVLRINQNNMRNFDFSILSQFQRLEDLVADGRQGNVSSLWPALSQHMQYLRIWTIDQEIPEDAFNRCPNMKHLDISRNDMTRIERNTFKELRNLESLDISQTRITTLDAQTFASQSNLRYLRISFSQINELPDGIFEPLVSLGKDEDFWGLTISFANLTSLRLGMFGHHPYLKNVDFASNNISRIERGIFSRFNQKMNRVMLFGNKCIDTSFNDALNLDENDKLEWCFNNFDGITTTTEPNGSGVNFRTWEVIGIVFAGLIKSFWYF